MLIKPQLPVCEFKCIFFRCVLMLINVRLEVIIVVIVIIIVIVVVVLIIFLINL